MQDNRHRILQAAALVYAQHGYRGATTRRIAEEAGVNEITVFRHFGNKSALLATVVHEGGVMESVPPLPAVPADPERELTSWIQARMDHTRRNRRLIVQIMSEMHERPDMAPCVGHGPVDASNQLRDYVVRLRRHGLLDTNPEHGLQPLEVNAAVAMLMNAYFGDAMSREMMPDMFPSPANQAVAAYVRVFLRAIGFQRAALPRALATAVPSST